MKREWIIGALIGVVLGGVGVWWVLCKGGGGGGRAGPRFRRIRLLNASDTKITKLEVWNTTGTPMKIGQVPAGTVVQPDGPDPLASIDHFEKEWNNTDGRQNVSKFEVRIWVEIGGVEKTLDAVEAYSGNANSTFADVMVVLDNHTTVTSDFEVALFAAHAADVADAHSNVVVEAARAPKP